MYDRGMSRPSDRAILEAAGTVGRGGCVALTGAGISVPSGIPDFRSHGGLWDRFPPEEYATAAAWRTDPHRVWELFRDMGRLIAVTRPSDGHLALARLEKMGLVDAVVTQNIDGLHQQAGSGRVVEFHGSAVEVACESCGLGIDVALAIGYLDMTAAPTCPSCGGWVRPTVVLFGEPIPERALLEATSLAARCRSMLVVGTSAVVAPASLLPLQASMHGAPVIEVNPCETDLTARADVVLRGPAEEVLPRLEAAIRDAG